MSNEELFTVSYYRNELDKTHEYYVTPSPRTLLNTWVVWFYYHLGYNIKWKNINQVKGVDIVLTASQTKGEAFATVTAKECEEDAELLAMKITGKIKKHLQTKLNLIVPPVNSPYAYGDLYGAKGTPVAHVIESHTEKLSEEEFKQNQERAHAKVLELLSSVQEVAFLVCRGPGDGHPARNAATAYGEPHQIAAVLCQLMTSNSDFAAIVRTAYACYTKSN